MTHLLITRGAEAGTRIVLSGFPVSIGRDESNEVSLQDSEVSRHHARIKQNGRLFILEDLESKNGVFLNGDKILNSIINNEDRILIGSTELVFFANAQDIHLAGDLLALEFSYSEDPELSLPLHLDREPPYSGAEPKRIILSQAIDQISADYGATKEIFDCLTTFESRTDMRDLGQSILKSLGAMIPGCTKGCIFLWDSLGRNLVALSSLHFGAQKENFAISKRAHQDAINRKQALILIPNVTDSTVIGQARIIIPCMSRGEVIATIHLETSQPVHLLNSFATSQVISLAAKATPFIDNLVLRREQDVWLIGMVESMIATIEAKDTYTLGHSERVCKYSMGIADELHLNRELKKQLMISSLCHDIGKIGVPDAILKKAALLSHEEYEEMKLHPVIGAKIIEKLPNAKRFLGGIKYHHEKFDGTGYPEGLEGEKIPFFGRIVALADAFDAMISGRSYSGFMEAPEAIEKLHEEAELFDPEILKAFTRAWENGLVTQKSDTKAR